MPDPNRPLLAGPDAEWREFKYVCVPCGFKGGANWQAVMFLAGEEPPKTMRLPCFSAMVDRKTWYESAPMHLYRLAGPVTPADLSPRGGSQGRPTEEGGSEATNP